MNFFGNEVDFQNSATVKGSTYVFQIVQKCNFLLMSAFSVFFVFCLNTIKKTAAFTLATCFSLSVSIVRTGSSVQKHVCVCLMKKKKSWNKQSLTKSFVTLTKGYGSIR